MGDDIESVVSNISKENYQKKDVYMINVSSKVVFVCLQLTAVNSVVFTVKAVDADGDMITYIIDQSSVRFSTALSTYWCPGLEFAFMNSPIFCYLQRDAWFFRIDLPNSGNVVLNKPLDYETRTQLQFTILAQVI